MWSLLPSALQRSRTDHVPVLADEVRTLLGVRPGETHWKGDIDKLLAENKDQIQAILREYHVPQLDVQGNLIQ